MANGFVTADPREWTADAVKRSGERALRREVRRRALRVIGGRRLATGNLIVIRSVGKTIYRPVEKTSASAPRVTARKPAIQSDAWRRDRLASGARAPETCHAAPGEIGAGRI